MSNTYLKVTIEKNYFLKTTIFEVSKIRPQVSFWVPPTYCLLKLKNQRSESKSMRGFSVILILKGVMTLSQRVHTFC